MDNKNCWTCTKPNPTHKVWREALLDYEWTCTDCHKKEYPELYDASECDKCGYTKGITGGHGDYGYNFYCKMCVEQVKWLQEIYKK